VVHLRLTTIQVLVSHTHRHMYTDEAATLTTLPHTNCPIPAHHKPEDAARNTNSTVCVCALRCPLQAHNSAPTLSLPAPLNRPADTTTILRPHSRRQGDSTYDSNYTLPQKFCQAVNQTSRAAEQNRNVYLGTCMQLEWRTGLFKHSFGFASPDT